MQFWGHDLFVSLVQHAAQGRIPPIGDDDFALVTFLGDETQNLFEKRVRDLQKLL